MKTFLSIICVTILAAFAQAETPNSQPAQSNQTTTTTTATSTTESTGTVTEFTPGSALILNTGSGEPVHYKVGKTVTYTNAKGKTITAERIRKDRKVRVHYVKEGNDMVVDSVTIVRP